MKSKFVLHHRRFQPRLSKIVVVYVFYVSNRKHLPLKILPWLNEIDLGGWRSIYVTCRLSFENPFASLWYSSIRFFSHSSALIHTLEKHEFEKLGKQYGNRNSKSFNGRWRSVAYVLKISNSDKTPQSGNQKLFIFLSLSNRSAQVPFRYHENCWKCFAWVSIKAFAYFLHSHLCFSAVGVVYALRHDFITVFALTSIGPRKRCDTLTHTRVRNDWVKKDIIPFFISIRI